MSNAKDIETAGGHLIEALGSRNHGADALEKSLKTLNRFSKQVPAFTGDAKDFDGMLRHLNELALNPVGLSRNARKAVEDAAGKSAFLQQLTVNCHLIEEEIRSIPGGEAAFKARDGVAELLEVSTQRARSIEGHLTKALKVQPGQVAALEPVAVATAEHVDEIAREVSQPAGAVSTAPHSTPAPGALIPAAETEGFFGKHGKYLAIGAAVVAAVSGLVMWNSYRNRETERRVEQREATQER